jgi:hypothetical protein
MFLKMRSSAPGSSLARAIVGKAFVISAFFDEGQRSESTAVPFPFAVERIRRHRFKEPCEQLCRLDSTRVLETHSETACGAASRPAAGTNWVSPGARRTKVKGQRRLDMLSSDKTVDFHRGFDGVSKGIKSVDRQ